MSRTIDERVVQMQFDNKKFEANAKTSMGTIESLKKSLDFTGSVKGLNNVDKAAKSIDLRSLINSVELVASRFTTLGIVSVTALQNITNKAINAGEQLVRSLALDPIFGGFKEYETQIGAIQTILANTSAQGTTLEQVTAALDELNLYADKTIYNFTEMTRNIGTFTAAGVDLKTSVEAIKGIANLAAMSGSTSQQASTAMYQLSQALAAGRVSLQDWNSVVNAGMGGKVFQNALMDTAEAMGIVVDRSISFRESISAAGGKDSWLTSEVLLNTLRQFTGDLTDAELAAMGFNDAQIQAIQAQAKTANEAATQVKTLTQLIDTMKEAVTSGWTETWEIIVGDFAEAKTLFTGISDFFGEFISNASNARNELLTGGLMSGWKQFLNQGISNQEDFLLSLEQAMTEYGYYENFLDDLIETHGSLENSFKSGWLTTDILANAVQKYTDRLNSMSEEERKAAGYTSQHITTLNELNKGIQEGTVNLDEFLKKMTRSSGRENIIEGIASAFKTLLAILKPVKDAFNDVFEAMQPEELYQMTVSFKNYFNNLYTQVSKNTKLIDNLRRTFSGLFSAVSAFWKLIGGALSTAFQVFGGVLGFSSTGIFEVTARIGDLITGFDKLLESTDLAANALATIQAVIRAGSSVVKNWVTSFTEIPQVRASLEAFYKIFSDLKNRFSTLANSISTILENFKLAGNFDFSSIKKLFYDLADAVKSAFAGFEDRVEDVKAFLKAFSEAADAAAEKVGTAFAKIKRALVSFIKFVSGAFDNIGLGEVLTVMLATSLILATRAIISAVDLFKKAIKTFTGPVDSFKGLLSELKQSLNVFQTKMKAEAFKSIAEGIGIIAASIAALSLLDQDKVRQSALTLGVFAAGIMAVSKAFGMFETAEGISGYKGAAMIVAISAAIWVLVDALKILEQVKMEGILKRLAVLGALAAGLSAVVIAIGKFAPGFSASAFGLVGVSAAIWILVDAFKRLENIDINGIKKNIIGISQIFGLFALITIASKSVKLTNAIGILGVALAFNTFLRVLEKMGKMDLKAIEENIKSYAMIFGAFSVLMISSNFAGKNATAVGASILMMSGAIVIIAEAMKILSSLDIEQIKVAGAIVTGLFGIFAAIMALSKFAGANAAKAGTAIFAMSAGMVMLSAAMLVMSKIDSEGLTRAVAAIAIMEGMFAVLMYVSRWASNGRKSIITIAGSITALAAVLAVMSMIKPERLTGATIALTSVMGMFAILMRAMPTVKGAYSSIVVMTVAVAAIGGVLSLMSMFNTENAIKNAAGISILLLAITAILKIGGGIDPFIAADIAIGISVFVGIISALGLVVTAIAGLIAKIPGIDQFIADAQRVVTGIFNVLGSIVGGFAGGVISGVGASIATTLPLIAAGLSAFGEGIQPFLESLKNVNKDSLSAAGMLAGMIIALTAADVINAIGQFLLGGVGPNLTLFAADLIPFGESIKEFTDVISTVDQEALQNGVDAIYAITAMAKAIPSEGGLKGLVMGSQDLEDFSSGLVSLGEALVDYSETVGGETFDIEAINQSVEAASALVSLAQAIPEGFGLIDMFTGYDGLDQFGNQLSYFAEGLVAYSEIVSGETFSASAITSSAEAAKALVDLGNQIPPQGGFISIFTGRTDFKTFGLSLAAFGEGLANYVKSVEGVTADAVQPSIEASKVFMSLSEVLPNSLGLIGMITGGKMDLQTFGIQIGYLGEGIKSYADNTSGIDVSGVETSVSAMKTICSLNDSLPLVEGIMATLTKGTKMDMATFGYQIVSLGDNIRAYSESVKGINTDGVKPSVDALIAISSLYGYMPNVDGLFSFLSDHQMSLTNFASQIVTLGEGMSAFYTQVSWIDLNRFDEVMTKFEGLSELFTSLSGINIEAISSIKDAFQTLSEFSVNAVIENFTTGLGNNTSYLKEIATTMCTTMLNSFTSQLYLFEQSGKNMGQKVGTGLSQAQSDVNTASNNIANGAVEALNSYIESFKTAGTNSAMGYAQGLSDYASQAAEEARKMAQASVDAINSTLDINSPSKVTEKSGIWTGMGFSKGISKMIPTIRSKGFSMGKASLDSLREAISNAETELARGNNLTPTIRPIVDLSDVTKSSEEINSIFGVNRRFSLGGFGARIQNVSAGIHSRQNGVNAVPEGETGTPAVQNFNFTQNNYSPKALSRADIYRQTKNQFSRAKGMVNKK